MQALSQKDKLRIAIVVSHPIQHFCPQYASFARHPFIQLKVFFASSLGHKSYFDPNFKQSITWSNLGLDEFEHEFLNNGEVLQPDANLDVPDIGETLEKFKPGLVIIYGYFQKFQRRVHKWARSKNIPLAYISDSERRQKRSKLKELIKYPYLRMFFSGIDNVLTVGDANEEYYEHLGVKKQQMVRMHFPIDVAVYERSYSNREELRLATRQRYGIAENEFAAAVAGKLVSWKSQDHIIDAMLQLESEGVFMHLFVLGSGETHAMLVEKAAKLTKSKVHFPGFVSPNELPAYYTASDVYIHPAAAEPHSLAISEAIYMARPVIISDTCGSWGDTDDVQHNKNGFVYPFGNINELSKVIRWMIEHPAERREFGKHSHDIAVIHQEKAHGLVLDDLLSRLNYAERTKKVGI